MCAAVFVFFASLFHPHEVCYSHGCNYVWVDRLPYVLRLAGAPWCSNASSLISDMWNVRSLSLVIVMYKEIYWNRVCTLISCPFHFLLYISVLKSSLSEYIVSYRGLYLSECILLWFTHQWFFLITDRTYAVWGPDVGSETDCFHSPSIL